MERLTKSTVRGVDCTACDIDGEALEMTEIIRIAIVSS